ncbi:MAG: molybdopterin-guanine dinucleotide biosynthesis protein B [Candidatus Bathyarchaeota archaeon]|nr:molybdopterin-guanine dinucleotide biosynthesis protein B [Candidatus Bathyarchaeota archaeon]
MVLVIAAVGTSGSGKTTTLEYLISNLTKEGYKIGTIKHVHHRGFSMDKEGSNTWRHAKAGSKVTAAISPEEIAVIKKTDAALNDLDQVIALLEREQLDIIFIEGFHSLIAKREDVPKLITAKDVENLHRTLEGTAQPILAVTGVIGENKPADSGTDIPILKLPEEGEQILQLIRKHYKENPYTPRAKAEGKQGN